MEPRAHAGRLVGRPGAAVAAGLGPIAIARRRRLGPHSVELQRLVGLKATFGRVPAWPPSLTGDLSKHRPDAAPRSTVRC